MARIRFNIQYSTSDGAVHNFLFDPRAALEEGTSILRIEAPFTSGEPRYFFNFSWDGVEASPPEGGFATITDLWAWIQTSLINLGKWYLLPNKVVAYLKAEEATMSIEARGVQAMFPLLADGQSYSVTFNGQSSEEDTLFTRGEVLTYVRNSWGDAGQWFVSGDYLVYLADDPESVDTLGLSAGFPGAFDNSFNDDFG